MPMVENPLIGARLRSDPPTCLTRFKPCLTPADGEIEASAGRSSAPMPAGDC